MHFEDLIEEVFWKNTDKMLDQLVASYGEIEDKKALYDFTNRNSFYKTPTKSIKYFQKDFVKNFGLTGDYIASACFINTVNSEGCLVASNSKLGSKYIFLYKKLDGSLVIHPFEVHEGKWKLITPIKVSVDDGSLEVEILFKFTTTPDGNGRNYILPNAKELKDHADYNLLFFCFIINECYAKAET